MCSLTMVHADPHRPLCFCVFLCMGCVASGGKLVLFLFGMCVICVRCINFLGSNIILSEDLHVYCVGRVIFVGCMFFLCWMMFLLSEMAHLESD